VTHRSLATARGLYGATLLIVPAPLVRAAGGRHTDPRARRVARILGLRQLAEAAVLATQPRGTLRVAGAAVDAVHALTALGVAAVDGRRRRLAIVNALTASAFAVAGCRAE
jgi:hypothetical protein